MSYEHQPTSEKETTGVVMSLQEIMDARGPGSLHQAGLDLEAEFLAFWYDTHLEEPTRKDLRAWCWDNLRKEHLEKCLTHPITTTND
jgi:hypothetical protein